MVLKEARGRILVQWPKFLPLYIYIYIYTPTGKSLRRYCICKEKIIEQIKLIQCRQLLLPFARIICSTCFPEVYNILGSLVHSEPLSELLLLMGVYRPYEQFCLIIHRELVIIYFDKVFISFKMVKTRSLNLYQ